MAMTPETAQKKLCPIVRAAFLVAGKKITSVANCIASQCVHWTWVPKAESQEQRDWNYLRKHEPKVAPGTSEYEARRLWREYYEKASHYLNKWSPRTPKGDGWRLKEKKVCDETGVPIALWVRSKFVRRGTCQCRGCKCTEDGL